MDTVIQARGLTKRYNGHWAVRGIDLAVAARQCCGFLGPNGAGKTTTLNMILGRSPMDGGTLSVFGLPMPAQAARVRARIGLVPQADNLDPELSIVDNLLVYGAYFGLPRRLLRRRITELLDFVELSERAGERPGALSGGMRRRATFARALINDPELIVLDEPTTGLDPQARHMIWSRLRDLKSRGRTLLLTTHYMEEAERLCDRLIIMDHGRILEQGPPAQLIRRHVEPQVLELHGSAAAALRRLDGGHRLEQVGDTLYCYTDDPGTVLASLDGELLYVQRHGNLEDVFMRLTGRELRD